jgi:ribonuclease P protein component
MLRKTQRLRTAGFNEVFKVGRRFHTPHFQIIALKSADFHASVVVGKKVYKTAVARNRLRRQVYGALYRVHQVTPLLYTVIVVAKPSLKAIPQRSIALAVEEAVVALGLR